jgi:hypothetical protein
LSNETQDARNLKQQDVQLILKLYELRRDEELRRARQWFFTEFNPQSAAEIVALMLSGERRSAYYRMITSYWDMAASFVNNGGIDERMFLDANTEHVAVFAKLEPFIAEVREAFGEQQYLTHLEQLIRRIPDAEGLLGRRRKLLSRWAKQPERIN